MINLYSVVLNRGFNWICTNCVSYGQELLPGEDPLLPGILLRSALPVCPMARNCCQD